MNFLEIFDDTVTDEDLWDMTTGMFFAGLMGMLLAVAIYVVVTL